MAFPTAPPPRKNSSSLLNKVIRLVCAAPFLDKKRDALRPPIVRGRKCAQGWAVDERRYREDPPRRGLRGGERGLRGHHHCARVSAQHRHRHDGALRALLHLLLRVCPL